MSESIDYPLEAYKSKLKARLLGCAAENEVELRDLKEIIMKIDQASRNNLREVLREASIPSEGKNGGIQQFFSDERRVLYNRGASDKEREKTDMFAYYKEELLGGLVRYATQKGVALEEMQEITRNIHKTTTFDHLQKTLKHLSKRDEKGVSPEMRKVLKHLDKEANFPPLKQHIRYENRVTKLLNEAAEKMQGNAQVPLNSKKNNGTQPLSELHRTLEKNRYNKKECDTAMKNLLKALNPSKTFIEQIQGLLKGKNRANEPSPPKQETVSSRFSKRP